MSDACAVGRNSGLFSLRRRLRRRELLAGLGVAFEVVVADVTEHEEADHRSAGHGRRTTRRSRPTSVAARHPRRGGARGGHDRVHRQAMRSTNRRDAADARAMLRRLSGRTHTVFTGLAIRRLARRARKSTRVVDERRSRFKATSTRRYDRGLPGEGAHPWTRRAVTRIQDHQRAHRRGVFEGSLTNIIGLPLSETTKQTFDALPV